MSKKAKYYPVDSDVVDMSFAVTEFANLLQLAAKMAAEENDVKTILKIANVWFKFIKIVEVEETPDPPTTGYGFSKSLPEIERSESLDGISADKN